MNYIENLKSDERIVEHYFCKQKQTMKSKNGKNYLSLKLQDKTGQINGKVWELNNDIQNFEEGDYIKIDGSVLTYQSELQLKITKIRKSQDGEIDPANYIPCTTYDIGTLYGQIVAIISTIKNQYVRKLLEGIAIDHPFVSEAFKINSAAKSMHHSYMGGLVEHTVSVVTICDFLSGHYKSVNRDILVATAILHDIGKVFELSPFPENDYTDDGQLLGHIIMGTELITETAKKIDGFPHELLTLLKHSILAHHGEFEYGSPKRPKTLEAFALHCADNLDAKFKMIEEAIEADNTQGNWVGYHRMLQRNLRKTEQFEK